MVRRRNYDHRTDRPYEYIITLNISTGYVERQSKEEKTHNAFDYRLAFYQLKEHNNKKWKQSCQSLCRLPA